MSFAEATSEATGQAPRTTRLAIARADALGDEALAKVVNTSLDSGVELDALAKLDAPERAELIERAAAGEQVSARAPALIQRPKKPTKELPAELLCAVTAMVHSLGFGNYLGLISAIDDLPELSREEQETLDDALEIFRRIGALEVV